MTRPSDSQKKKKKKRKKKENLPNSGLPSQKTTVKLKESSKRAKYLDLVRELKKLRDMKVTAIPIIIGALGTVIKGLIKGQEDLEIRRRVKTH